MSLRSIVFFVSSFLYRVFFLFHLVDVDVKWCGMNGPEFMSLLHSSSFYIFTDRRIRIHSQADMGERIPLWCRCVVGLCSFKTSFAGGRDGSIVGRVRRSVGIACQDGEAQATAAHIDLGIQTDPDSQAEVLDYFGMFHSGFWFEGMGNHRSGQKWRWLVRASNKTSSDWTSDLLRTSDCKTCVSCHLHSPEAHLKTSPVMFVTPLHHPQLMLPPNSIDFTRHRARHVLQILALEEELLWLGMQHWTRTSLGSYSYNAYTTDLYRSKNLKVFVSSNVVKHGQRPWNGRPDDYIWTQILGAVKPSGSVTEKRSAWHKRFNVPVAVTSGLYRWLAVLGCVGLAGNLEPPPPRFRPGSLRETSAPGGRRWIFGPGWIQWDFFFFGGGMESAKTLECFGGKKCWQRIWMEHFDAEICWFHDGIILGEGLKAWSKEFQWLKHIKTILLRYVRERLFRGWSIWRNCVEICYGLLRMDRFTKLFSSIQWKLPILMPL